ncbi:DUF2491 family protein [Maridesulfovibrio sp. FT414]|uniref:DUF2491 family protein n=1 Tax=Maridesulfovibrio sp. FT414 TaxID=2979469 RepID=UPI003D807000
MGSWKTISRILKNKIDNVTKNSSNQDINEDIPFGMNIGGKVGIDISTFLLFEENLVTVKPLPEYNIISHGIAIIEGERIDRLYLSTDIATEAVLEIMHGEDDNSYESRFYIPFDRIYPQSKEEWAFWLDEKEGYIGWEAFELNETIFDRLWMPGAQHVAPVSFTEKLNNGSDHINIHHETMMYARTLNAGNDMAEYLLAELYSSPADDHISIMTGVRMPATGIRLIY